MPYNGGSWYPDYGWNPLPVVAAKETSLANLRTAIGSRYINSETAWYMLRSTDPNITADLGDYYYCLQHWPSH
jgi:hypothetical protein